MLTKTEMIEKNTLLCEDDSFLRTLFANSPNVLREYLDAKIKEYDTFEEYMNSESVLKIWKLHTESIIGGKIDHSYFGKTKGKHLSTYYRDKRALFTFREFIYLAFGVDHKNQNPLTFDICSHALSKDKHFLDLPVPPVVSDLYLPIGLTNKLYNNFVFKKPSSMDYEEYFDRNQGYCRKAIMDSHNLKNLEDVKNDILDFIERGNDIYELYTLERTISDSMEYYESFESNRFKTDFMFIAFQQLVLEKGLDYFLEKEGVTKDFYNSFKYIFLALCIKAGSGDKYYSENYLKIKAIYVAINQYDKKFQESATSLTDFTVPILVEALEKGEIETIYANQNYYLRSNLNKKSLQLLKDNFENLSFSKEEYKEKMKKMISECLVTNVEINPSTLAKMTTKKMQYELKAIFGEDIENTFETKQNVLNFYSFIEENKEDLFYFESKPALINRKQVDILAISDFKEGAVEKLIKEFMGTN